MRSSIADIAVPVSLFKTFHYTIPDELAGSLADGSRVLVPLGTRRVTGTVVGFPARTDQPRLKAIAALAGDPVPDDLMRLGRWMADYYLHPLGLTLETMVPKALGASPRRVRRLLRLLDGDHDMDTIRGPKQMELLLLLCDRQVVPFEELGGFASSTIQALCRNGMAQVLEEAVPDGPHTHAGDAFRRKCRDRRRVLGGGGAPASRRTGGHVR